MRKKLKDCAVKIWQNDVGDWNCFIESPFCSYVSIHASAKSEEESKNLCLKKWKDNYGKNNRKKIEALSCLKATQITK